MIKLLNKYRENDKQIMKIKHLLIEFAIRQGDRVQYWPSSWKATCLYSTLQDGSR